MRSIPPFSQTAIIHQIWMDSQVEEWLSRAESLYAKFKQGSETCYIDEAILLDRGALDLSSPGHPMRSNCLMTLSQHIWNRYMQLGGVENLNEAIFLGKEALALCPEGHLDRSVALNNLALYVSTRYEQFGELEDLEKAIVMDRGALALRPPGHPDRSMSLNNLATRLWSRYNQLGNVEDLEEAILLDRDALALRQPGHPSRPVSLNNLAIRLWSRYNLLGGVEDLEEAIVMNRETLVLCPPMHPGRSMSLNNLALHLYSRYEKLGAVEDLEEAIVLDRDALALRPPGHPSRSMSLSNLALHLSSRYEEYGGVEDLEEAIVLDRDALALRPPGHPDRSMSLNNLALHLWRRYGELGGVEDLEEAVVHDRDALSLCPPGYPDRSIYLTNLAIRLSSRYNQLGAVEDLEEAIVLDRGALALLGPGHPQHSTSLNFLANHLLTRYKQLGHPEDRDEVFSLYSMLARGVQTVSLDTLAAVKDWVNVAEDFHHSTIILAYETALQFLVHHLAALPSLPQHLTLLKALSSSLAVDAFSACLRYQSPMNAVELLEQGRGVFWTQLTHLHSPLDDVIASGPEGTMLADQFNCLTSHIRNALNSTSTDQHNRVWHLNLELQRVVSSIRELPGHSRFLLPSLFSDLQRAASGGPIIIVNASNHTCDVLIVLVDRDPVHIPLSITKVDVYRLSSKLRTLTLHAKKSDVTREFGIILRELWNHIVSPIVDALLTTHPIHSRIWWCPTAEFSPLPLHAAGPYRKGQKNLASLYISSYTTTLSALIRARQHSPSSPLTERKRFLGLGQATASGQNELLSVGTELTNIGRCIDGLAEFTRIEGQDCCVSRVAEELSKNEWVHLACHGLPNQKQPFESAFALHDGRFTIQRIIQSPLQNPEFAYLSACHTTVGDEESPDEVIHLASAMQFAGFRSVIGTMWAVDDAETNKITSVFYMNMMDESGRLDHTRAAYALWKTMRMKSADVPLDQRILYIHLGA